MTRPSSLALKAWAGGVGVATGVIGVALERRWLVWVAVALLAVAFLFRFAERKG